MFHVSCFTKVGEWRVWTHNTKKMAICFIVWMKKTVNCLKSIYFDDFLKKKKKTFDDTSAQLIVSGTSVYYNAPISRIYGCCLMFMQLQVSNSTSSSPFVKPSWTLSYHESLALALARQMKQALVVGAGWVSSKRVMKPIRLCFLNRFWFFFFFWCG